MAREDSPQYGDTEQGVRDQTATLLRSRVTAMSVDNFIVVRSGALWSDTRRKRPTEVADDDEEPKRFDLMMLHLQLAVLHVESGFERLKEQVRSIVGMLQDKSNIPMVREQMVLIDAIAGEEWWQDVWRGKMGTSLAGCSRKAEIQ